MYVCHGVLSLDVCFEREPHVCAWSRVRLSDSHLLLMVYARHADFVSAAALVENLWLLGEGFFSGTVSLELSGVSGRARVFFSGGAKVYGVSACVFLNGGVWSVASVVKMSLQAGENLAASCRWRIFSKRPARALSFSRAPRTLSTRTSFYKTGALGKICMIS